MRKLLLCAVFSESGDAGRGRGRQPKPKVLGKLRILQISPGRQIRKRPSLRSYSEKLGYKIQSSSGQEWQRERDARAVTRDEISAVVAEKLKELMGALERPRFKNRPFPWAAPYGDGRRMKEERVQTTADQASVTIDFRYQAEKDPRGAAWWIQESASEPMRHRLVWVAGAPGTLSSSIRDPATWWTVSSPTSSPCP